MLAQSLGGYLPVDWALLFVGVCLIAVALTFGSRWKNTNPIDLSSEKLGTLKLPFVSFLVLMGVAFAGVGVYFRWQDTQSGVAQLHQLQNQVQGLTQELERFKKYEMNVQLDFHESVDPTRLKTHLLILNPGDPSPRSIDQGILKSTSANNLLSATVPSLGPGDTIYFEASETVPDHPRAWKSESLTIPIAQLNMNPKQ